MRRPLRLAPLLLAAALVSACYAPTVNRERSYHPSDADLTVTRIVHASLILDFGTTRVLVDPWFAPSPPIGQREPIGIAPDRLPPARGIIITHAHDDHFDRETLESYPDKSVRLVTVRGLGGEVREMGYTDVVEVVPWEQSQIGSVILVAVPALHTTDEVGFVLQGNGLVVYLAGDTMFDEATFRSVAAAFPRIDVAILPIGGIRVLGRRIDMTPVEAARAVEILRPRRAIPTHYGLTGPFPFVLSASDPARRFAEEVESARPQTQVVALEPGESWHYYR